MALRNALDATATTLSAGRVFRRLLGLCWRYRSACVKVLACQAALLAFALGGLGAAGLGVDYLRHLLQPGRPPVPWPLGWAPPESWPPMLVIALLAGLVLVAAGLRTALGWLSGVTLADLVHARVVAGLQTEVYAKLQRLDFAFHGSQGSGGLINRGTGDIQAVRTFVETVLIQSLVTLFTLAIHAAYMIAIHPGLTAACLATLPLLWLASVAFSRSVHPEYVRNRGLFDRMILTLAESVQGIGVIKGFAREREATARFETDNRAVREQQRRIFRRVSAFSPVIDFLTQVNLVILLLYGGRLVINGELPLGTGLVVFAGLLQQFSNQISATAQIANAVQESLTGARRVFELLDAPAGVPRPEKPVRLGACRGAIRFDRVCFGYSGPRSAVLRDVSFAIEPGRCVAIVGETGSGKSALLGLVPRFYDPTSGTVSIDGHDLRTLDPEELRRQVAVVFQESFLFSDTVAANIAFGRPTASREAIVAAAEAARAHDFICALTNGYDTVLGEAGVDLSGGQRQRLAIARALLIDPAILLLDDPTAAIDPETEHEILTAIERATRNRTTLIVAHRLSTLQRADLILVLEKGRIVQRGTHEELLRGDGPYRRAARLQMVDDESRRVLDYAGALAEGLRP
jgi:ATP-binding cassette, subfamily B, bacterial